ncbi:FAD-dependent oxidoreductase [Gallaecimonas kandeliae]|uniref:FAD-dependent oxidoreductase n=1 Tax=Gallaecimonas kandeliae TaxID=3029055 RepID=UPI002647246D|nr:FAD-dependent oxidoreductase [Gallaecimonas kandeliae]WKE65398.1 FAD-dependent oxidoreductase [Gallaecimonas kandeliae]
MRVAVVGGGINGLCVAWQLALDGHQVSLFERGELMAATSAASSKLLHGGLRYLEQGRLGLVREALKERHWWLQQAPELAHPLPILYPLYQGGRRKRWQLKLGLLLYDLLAGRRGLGRHRWLSAAELSALEPGLKRHGLLGGYRFFDGQMDDRALGLWVAQQCQGLGVALFEHSEVQALRPDGALKVAGHWQQFDWVLNLAGPWSEQLLRQSALEVDQPLSLVRGSHLLLGGKRRQGLMLEVPGERRLVFVLPYLGSTLLGTTEVAQTLDEPIHCSAAERGYLKAVYDHYFVLPLMETDIKGSFAGLRPLLHSQGDPSLASRDYALSVQGRLLTVSGGKWTTARALARKVAARLKGA